MSLLADQKTPVLGAAAHTDSAATFVPDQSRAARLTSFTAADFVVPHGREEEWRFTPVDRLQSLIGTSADGAGAGGLEHESALPEGVTLREVSTDEARSLGIMSPADRPAALAAENAGGALLLEVPADLELTEPVRISLRGNGSGEGSTPAFMHLVVSVGRFAKATVIVEHTGSARLAQLVSIVTGDGSDLTLVSSQEWQDDSLHLAQQDVVVGRDARVRHIVVTLGGEVVRINTNATYAGPGGSFEGLGVYFADAGQHQEHRLFVDHEATNCRSNVEYKGALQGETAHTVWVGDVLIRASAEGTNTYELNRNLILTDGARADSVPNLEIETGEIEGAGHAAATGRFDDEQLFYLQARGIPEDAARRLVVRGFFASIVNRIGVPEVSDHLMAAIDAELEGVGQGVGGAA